MRAREVHGCIREDDPLTQAYKTAIGQRTASLRERVRCQHNNKTPDLVASVPLRGSFEPWLRGHPQCPGEEYW